MQKLLKMSVNSFPSPKNTKSSTPLTRVGTTQQKKKDLFFPPSPTMKHLKIIDTSHIELINIDASNNKSKGKKIAESKQDIIMQSLQQFFKVPQNLGKMLPILNKTANISLRVLDWFVTNYAKNHNVEYIIKKSSRTNASFRKKKDKDFNVYLDYKQQLKAYSKQQFDPFCRKWRKQKGNKKYHGILFYYAKDKHIETTVGQLNFFRWIISNKVLDYVITHLTAIMEEMLISTKKTKLKKKSDKKEPDKNEGVNLVKKKFSIAATKKITKKYVSIDIQFN